MKTIEALKSANPNLKVGLIGAKVAVDAEGSLKDAPAVDFVARNEFDFTIKEVAEGRDFSAIKGLSYRDADGAIVHNEDRADARGHGPAAVRHAGLQARPDDRELFHRLSEAPLHLVLHRAAAANRAAPSACGRRRSAATATARAASGTSSTRSAGRKKAFPQVKEFFFDDDTFTDDLPRAEAIASELGKLGITWSCNAKANVPRETLEGAARQRPAPAARRLRDRQPADPAQHQEGHAGRGRQEVHQGLPRARHHDPRHLHPRPARRDARRRSRRRSASRREINPHTIQVSLAAPYPGTFLYKQAMRERLARRRQRRTGRRPRRPDRAAALSASEPHRDLPLGRGVLPSASISARRRSPRSSARWCARPR